MRDPAAGTSGMADTPAPPGPHVAMGRYDEPSGYAVRRRAGTLDWLLMLTESGRGRFGGPRHGVDLEPGTLIAVAPGTPHDYGVHPDAERWGLLWAHVGLRSEWLGLLMWPEPLPGVRRLVLTEEQAAPVAVAMGEALAHWRSPSRWSGAYALNLLERALLLAASTQDGPTRGDERVAAVLEYIDAHLAGELSVSVLSGVAHLSPSRLSHLFLEEVRQPPQRYVEQRRLVLAAQLLELTDSPVGAVARAVGFKDPLYFSTRFKQRTGQSPSAFRAARSARHGI